jgi:UDP-N-acetylglucosamine--N-acetylmuramyl-(pentapeptide) pyrophosphoryl-undecaprenol N-acetylglucosamine transferase
MSIADTLSEKFPKIELLFIAEGLSKNPYFDRSRFSYKEIPSGSFSGRNPLKIIRSSSRIGKGFIRGIQILKEFKPDLVVGFGSYYTLPLLLAAKWAGVPIVLHEANAIPGKVNRLLARYVALTAIHFPQAADYLKGVVEEARMPLRKGYALNAVSQEEAYSYFGLDPSRQTLLVFGGSQGSLAINRLVSQSIIKNKQLKEHFQLLHFTGNEELAKETSRIYQNEKIPACVKAFECRMELAWEIADCLISRAGASTIAEQIEYEVPGILIPYPYATDLHQDANAQFLAKMGGGLKIDEKRLQPGDLSKVLLSLTENEESKLTMMRQAIKKHKLHCTQPDFCDIIERYLGG